MLYVMIGLLVFVIMGYIIEKLLLKRDRFHFSLELEVARMLCTIFLIGLCIGWLVVYGEKYSTKTQYDTIIQTMEERDIDSLSNVEKAHLIVNIEGINKKIIGNKNHVDGFFSIYIPDYFRDLPLIDYSALIE